MSELDLRLANLKNQVGAVKRAGMLNKAAMAEQALINAYFLLEVVVEKIGVLERG